MQYESSDKTEAVEL